MRRPAPGLVVALLLISRLATAQDTAAPLQIEVLLAAPTLAAGNVPTFTPDGRWLAYTVVDPRRRAKIDRRVVPWNAVGGDIWISRISGADRGRITSGEGNNWLPSWAPDGSRIAFLSDRAGNTSSGAAHVWLWERNSGRLRQASTAPALDPWGRLGRIEWLADSRSIVVKLRAQGQGPGAMGDLEGRVRRAAGDTGVTARIFRSDPSDGEASPRADPNNLDDFLGDLALVDTETGAVRRLARNVRICSYALSPDRRILAWAVAKRFERPGSYQILVDLFVHRLVNGETRRLVTDARLGFAYFSAPMFSWSPAGRQIAYRTSGPPGTPDELYAVSVDGTPPRHLFTGPPSNAEPIYEGRPLWNGENALLFARDGELWRTSVNGTGAIRFASAPQRSLRMIEHGFGALWSPDEGRSTVVVTGSPTTKRMGLARVDLVTGEYRQLLEEDRWYDTTMSSPPVVTPDRRAIVYAAQDARRPPDLWLARGIGAPLPAQVSRIAPGLAAAAYGRASVIEWRGLDGDVLRGALIYPAGYRPGIRYPLIVKVYGGTNVSDDLNLFGFANGPVENLQIFATRGYAVLLADSKLQVGTPVLDLLKTVLPGVNKTVEMGVADPARLGVMGHSYGGYATLALLTHSRRFGAGVVRAGIGDLVGAYGQLAPDGTNYSLAWAEQGQGRMGGTPWDFRERYIENSPIFYLDRIETPLLLVHGDLDLTASLSDQVFSGLRRLGRHVEYARYGGESHWEGLWSLPNQIDYLKRVVSWFDLHLKRSHRSDGTAKEGRADARPSTCRRSRGYRNYRLNPRLP